LQYEISEVHYHNDTISEKKPLPVTPSKNSIAVICHLFYTDVWQEIADYLHHIDTPFDLFVTVATDIEEKILKEIFHTFPKVRLYKVENRGRDVLPFYNVLDTTSYTCSAYRAF